MWAVLVGLTVATCLVLGFGWFVWQRSRPEASVAGRSQPEVRPTKTAQPDPPIPTVPLTGTPRVLFVLAAVNFWGAEYYPVRKRLEELGCQVEVASTADLAKPHQDPKAEAGDPVVPDVPLKNVDVSRYRAVIFPGGNSEEFSGKGPGAADAKRVIDAARQSRLCVAGIGSGVLILGRAGVLGEREVACQDRYLEELRKLGAKAYFEDLRVDDSIVTARSGGDIAKFVQAVVRCVAKNP